MKKLIILAGLFRSAAEVRLRYDLVANHLYRPRGYMKKFNILASLCSPAGVD